MPLTTAAPMQPQRTRNPTADLEAQENTEPREDWLKRLLSKTRLSDFEQAFREARCIDEDDVRAMGRETLAELGLNTVEAKRLQRTLAPPPAGRAVPLVVAACEAKAVVASAPVQDEMSSRPRVPSLLAGTEPVAAEAIAPLPPCVRGSNI